MACERFLAGLREVAAGRPATSGISGHLESCPSCRAELAALRRGLALADQVLGEITSAEPSPELRARIRQAAAAAEEVASPRPWRWAGMAAAAAVVTAAGIAVLWHARRVATPPVQPPVALASPSRPSAPAAAAVGGRPAGPEATTAGRASSAGLRGPAIEAPRRPSAPSHRPAEPEVLVPPGGEEALMRFVALVHERRASPPALMAAGQASPDLPEPSAIEIKPLEIVPLDPAETSGT